MSKGSKGRKTGNTAQPRSQTTPAPKANPPQSASPSLALEQGNPPLRLHLLILTVCAILLYTNTLHHGFVLDDAIVITENIHVQKGWSGLADIFNKDTFHGFFKTDKQGLVEGGRYRPFTLAMFAVELSIFGRSPFWGHLFNVLWYALCGIMIYLLTSHLFRFRWNPILSSWLAFAVALLFVAHPLHTEAVANIKGRDEIMALLGSLAALYFSMRSFQSGKIAWELLTVGCFLIGIFSKENAITFLAIVPLSYWFFTSASIGQIARYTTPFVGVALLFLLVRSNVLPNAQIGAASSELMNNPFLKLEGDRYVPFSGAERQATVFYTLGKYIQLFLVPYPLTHDYYPNHIPRMNWGQAATLFSFLLYLGMGLGGIWGLRKKSPLAYGLLFYLATLSIVSNVWLVVGTNMSERLVFMPSLGLCIALVMGLGTLFYGKKLQQTTTPRTLLLALGAYVLVLGALTVLRNPAWKSNLNLFRSDAKTSVNSAKVHNALGGQLISDAEKIENDSLGRIALLQEAETHLKQAVSIYPGYKDGFFLLGTCYLHLRNYPEAVKYLGAAHKLANTDANVKTNLALAYRLLGQEEGEKRGNVVQALQYLQQALALNPSDYATVRLLGVANSFSGNDQAALPYFEKAKDLARDKAEAWFELHMAYQKVGELDKAQQALSQAQKLDPQVVQKFNQKQANGGN